MYSVPTSDWTAAMQDWRQVGIMCNYILVDGAENCDYHTLEVTDPSDPEFSTMFTTDRTFVGAFWHCLPVLPLFTGFHDAALAEVWKRRRVT